MTAAVYDPAAIEQQLVGLSASQTLTNKTINDISNDVHADTVFTRVFNNTGVTLTKGQAVYASGYNVGQDQIEVDLSDASAASTANVLGIVDTDILTGQSGVVDVSGRISNVDTSSFSVADELYLSTTAGALTATKPTGTNIVRKVGEVLRSHATLGVLEVAIDGTDKTGFAETLLDDGTAAAVRTTLGVDAAGTDNSTDVTLAGTPDYLTLAGQVLTRGLIDLTTDVTGDLPVAEGGTGASTVADARTNLGVDAAGTDNSTDVTLAGTPDYITIAGQVITRGQIDLTADVTGVLPEANLPDASATAQGVVELATDAETLTGTDTTRATTPANVKAVYLGLAGGTMTGDIDAGGNDILNLGAVREDVNTVASTGATETFTVGAGDYTMDQACVFSMPGSLTSGDLHTVEAIIRGAFTPTFPAAVDWADATAPTYSSPSLYVFQTVDAGTTWLGVGRVGFA
jgi:hypothetical protein